MMRMIRAAAFGSIFLLALLRAANATGPSFDCENARSEAEKLICSDDALAALDMRLATNFAQALSHADANEVAGLTSAQRAWRTRMLKVCIAASSVRACLINAYNRRIGEL